MSNLEKATKTVKRSVYYLASHAAIFIVLLGIFGLTFVMFAIRNMPESTRVCYNGYYYKVDKQGVMWPEQTKYGVQKCPQGDNDVVSK